MRRHRRRGKCMLGSWMMEGVANMLSNWDSRPRLHSTRFLDNFVAYRSYFAAQPGLSVLEPRAWDHVVSWSRMLQN